MRSLEKFEPVAGGTFRRYVAVRILFYCIVGGFVDALLLIAGAEAPVAWGFVPIFAVCIITTSGEILLRVFRIRLEFGWLPAAFVVGITITSTIMMGPTILWHWSAQDAFLVWSALVLIGALVGLHRPPSGLPYSTLDLPIAFGIALFVGFFTRYQAAALPAVWQTGTLAAWSDYFVHGTLIASFGDPLALRAGDIMLPGAPRPFYHYAPFMLPAALSEVTNLPGLGLATAVLLPLGIFVGLCGLYPLAVELGGLWQGLLALLLVALLPDASHYGLYNPLFSFPWLLYAAPGSAYAIGLAAIAWLCMLRGLRGGKRTALILSVLLTLFLIPVRAHMFLLFGPALVGTIFLSLIRPTLRAQVLGLCITVCIGMTILLIAGVFDKYGGQQARSEDYLKMVFENGPTQYLTFLHHLSQQLGQVVATSIGGLLLMPATLGLWTFFFPAVAIWEARRGRFAPEDCLPVLLCLTYLALIFWAPISSTGDLAEYKHRHFVLLYVIIVLWTVLRLASLAGVSRALKRAGPAVSGGLIGALVLGTFLVFRDIDAARPPRSMTWAKGSYAVQVEPGIPDAAFFIRTHERQGDVLAVGGTGAFGALKGPAVELSSLTDLPVYVGRIDQYISARGPEIAALVKARASQMAAVHASPIREAAFSALRAYGVRWYVTVAPEMPAWDRTGATATYQAGSTFVYDTAIERQQD